MIAGFWRRVGAWTIDVIVLGAPSMALGYALLPWSAGFGQAGRGVGLVVGLIYFGVLDSRLGGGQTLGKRLLRIRVVDGAGQALSPSRSMVRFLVAWIPYFMNGLWFDVDAMTDGWWVYPFGAALIVIVFGGLGANFYLFVFNRRTQQGLHDIVVGSVVVRATATPEPLRLGVPTLHLAVTSCWLLITLSGSAYLVWGSLSRAAILDGVPLTTIRGLQNAVVAGAGVQTARITLGGVTRSDGTSAPSTVPVLAVNAEAGAGAEPLDQIAVAIAAAVLATTPDLLGRQVLSVNLQRGFDFGLARWTTGYRASRNAEGWRSILPPTR